MISNHSVNKETVCHCLYSQSDSVLEGSKFAARRSLLPTNIRVQMHSHVEVDVFYLRHVQVYI